MRAGWISSGERERVWPGNKVQLNGYVCKCNSASCNFLSGCRQEEKDERRGQECEWTAEDLDHGKCSRAMAISRYVCVRVCVCDGGESGRGAKACSPNLGREDRQPEQEQGGRKGSPGLLTPQPASPIENQSSPRRARQVGAASAAIPFGGLKLEAMHLQLA